MSDMNIKEEIDPQEKRFKIRKDIIKNIAIIFLAVMLVLTFFSNTIMNYSLPQVAVQYVTSGTITQTIRGTGSVTSGDPYNVMIKQSRTVQSVSARVGNDVKAGDVLFILAEGDSTELTAAKEDLEKAQDAYDKAVLSSTVTSGNITTAQSGVNVDSYREKLNAAQTELNTANTALTTAQSAVDTAQVQADAAKSNYENLYAAYSAAADTTVSAPDEQKAYDNAKTALDAASYAYTVSQNNYNTIKSTWDHYDDLGDLAHRDELTDSLNAADLDQIAKKSALDAAQLVYDQAKAALDAKVSANTSANLATLKANADAALVTKTNADAVLANAQKALDDAKKVVEEKTQKLNDLQSEISTVLDLNAYYDAVVDAKAKVDKLTVEVGSVEITAPIDGTVTEINVTSGKTASTDVAAVVLRPADSGFTMSFSLENDKAKMVPVGDAAEVANSWWYNDISGTVTSVKPDPSSPNKNRLITINLQGDLTEGQSLTMTISTRTSNYDLVVPNSALHEDKNGKFILVVESKSSPLGNRYFANRYDVEVLATDDTTSAIKTGLSGYEYVITSSSKPISAGSQVRLSES